MASNIINIILVALLLIGMVMLLSGIRSMFGEKQSSTEKLSKEIKEEENVISSNSIFSEFLSHYEEEDIEISDLVADTLPVSEETSLTRLGRD